MTKEDTEALISHWVTIQPRLSMQTLGGGDLIRWGNQGLTQNPHELGFSSSRRSMNQDVDSLFAFCLNRFQIWVVWVIRYEDPETRRMHLGYRFFGGLPGKPLPSLENLKVAKHSEGDMDGTKKERPAIRVVPKGKFQVIETTTELVTALFGVPSAATSRNGVFQVGKRHSGDQKTR